jgi:hypothetical protein
MPSGAALFGSLMFGVIGLAAFLYGKRSVLIVPMVLGMALMVFPYFVSDTWLLYTIGCALTVASWYFRH